MRANDNRLRHIRFARSGSTLVLTLIFLTVFTSLAIAFSAATNLNLRQADNFRGTQACQLAAESGMGFILRVLGDMSLSSTEAEEDLLLAVANALADQLDGTANLGEGEIELVGATVMVPAIEIDDDGAAFRAEITDGEAGTLAVVVTGSARGMSRRIQLNVTPSVGRSPVLDYGIASKSRIKMCGNAKVCGANDPSEAAILSATYSTDEAVCINGNCRLDGDISTTNPDSYVTIKGNPEIAGETGSAIDEHIHIGVEEGEMPEVDPTVFEPFATNIVDKKTKTTSDMVLENIRIEANTNPTFAGNCDIRGVVFIEQPNKVKFSGNVDITGVIVTEDAGEDNLKNNYLKFTGNVDSAGVEDLPDEPQFEQLKQMPGSAILAPGFELIFHGNVDTINGTMAADKYTFTGNVGGTVHGAILNYSDSDFEIKGNVDITIDREKYGDAAFGFYAPVTLAPVAGSYLEL